MLASRPSVCTEVSALLLLPGASPKIPSPSTDNTSNRNGTSLPPCPTAWWHFPDQPSPGVTQLPFTSPYLPDQGLYGLFIEQRDSAARSVAGCCRRRSIHSAPCVSAPANPLCGVRAPAAPHAVCFLSPPCPLDCPMILHSAGGCNDTLGSKGQEGTCSTQVASFPPSRQQIRWYLPIPPPVQQHRCHLLSLGLGEHSSHSSYWVSHPRLSSRTALAAAIPALWTGEAHWSSLVTPLEAESLHQNQMGGSRDHLCWEKEEELCQHLEASMYREVQLIPVLPESWSEARLPHVDVWTAATSLT